MHEVAVSGEQEHDILSLPSTAVTAARLLLLIKLGHVMEAVSVSTVQVTDDVLWLHLMQVYSTL